MRPHMCTHAYNVTEKGKKVEKTGKNNYDGK